LTENVLYYGDNLDILRRYIDDESIDLIYLDPPFNSKATYNVLFKQQNGSRAAAQIKAFEDTWTWDQASAASYQEVVEAGGQVSRALQAFRTLLGDSNMLAYLAMMAPRLVELHRVLKPTGSIYLHCDPTASHYLKVLMDAVFGTQNFRNELIWHYGGRGAKAVARQFPRNHDVVLLYSKEEGRQTYRKQTYERKYTYAEARRRGFRQDADGTWFKTAPRGDYTDESVKRLEREGRIYRTRTGRVRIKYFLRSDESAVYEDALLGDTWNDIPDAMHMGKERLGYPTQKPEALLERIIQTSSDEGHLVLDPFCGCGTAVVVAQRLNRRWIGIDITQAAIRTIKQRLADSFGDSVQYDVIGEPTTVADAKILASQDPYQFQWWALGLVDARPIEGKRGADKGIDGRLYFHDDSSGNTKQIIFSVKAGHTGVSHVRDLRGVLAREKAEIGVLISMQEPTQPMRTEAASAGFYESPWGKHPRIQLLTIADLLAGKKVDYPLVQGANVTYEKAPRAKKQQGRQGELRELL